MNIHTKMHIQQLHHTTKCTHSSSHLFSKSQTQQFTPPELAFHYTPPPFSCSRLVFCCSRETIRIPILGSRSMGHLELEWLQGQTPPGQTGIAVFQPIQPDKSTMVSFDHKGLPKEIHLECLNTNLHSQTLLFDC